MKLKNSNCDDSKGSWNFERRLITDHPPTSFNTVWKRRKQITCDMRHMTCDMWYVICDTWHVTHVTWQVGTGKPFLFFLLFSSLAFTVWEWKCIEDIFTNYQLVSLSINQWMAEVCWTAPATPGLLIILGCLIHIFFADPGKARGCSTNTSVTDWLSLSVSQSCLWKYLYGAAMPYWLQLVLLIIK